MTDASGQFAWLNSQAVRSDRGFEVESIDRFAEEYREGGRKVTVEVERGFEGGSKPCVIIEPTAFQRWDDDPPNKVLPPQKQADMLSNFRQAMEFQGIAVIVERRSS